jgi:hypothetical protein
MTYSARSDYCPHLMEGWQYKAAFVIQFRPETDIGAGRLEGRIEHMSSTAYESRKVLFSHAQRIPFIFFHACRSFYLINTCGVSVAKLLVWCPRRTCYLEATDITGEHQIGVIRPRPASLPFAPVHILHRQYSADPIFPQLIQAHFPIAKGSINSCRGHAASSDDPFFLEYFSWPERHLHRSVFPVGSLLSQAAQLQFGLGREAGADLKQASLGLVKHLDAVSGERPRKLPYVLELQTSGDDSGNGLRLLKTYE